MSLIKIPTDASPEVIQALREVDDLLTNLLGGLNINLKGRRIINTGNAASSADYTNRDDVVRMIRAGGGRLNNDGTPIGTSGQTT